jgi:two-component system response regulator AtoC
MESVQILFVSREGSRLDLSLEARGWQVETACSSWEALDRVHAGPGPDLVVLELSAGDGEGLHTLCWIRRVRPDLPVLVVASCDDAGQRLEAIRLGAQDYLLRPLRPQQLETAIRRSFFTCAESTEGEVLADEIEQIGDDMFFVAASPTMRKLRAQADLLAQVNASVLILGENGCGKELAARLIHKLSVRSGFRFLKVNCASLPGDMLEAEIFGVSGHGRTKLSKLEVCQRGTLLLDEITEMPLSLQTKLLHALRDGYFVRAGDDARVEMDVRILAATKDNLEAAIGQRKLREDLYYRLSAFTVHVPALRQRKEEIPLLLGHFMNRLARRYNLPARIFSAAAVEACQQHSWPGNLGELEKFVKRYLVMGDGRPDLGRPDVDTTDADAASEDEDGGFRRLPWQDSGLNHLRLSSSAMRNSPAGFNEGPAGWLAEVTAPRPAVSGLKSLVQSVKNEAERSAIASALEEARWNRKAAARLLKVSYRTLLYKIEQYHMSPPATPFGGYGSSGAGRERLHKG